MKVLVAFLVFATVASAQTTARSPAKQSPQPCVNMNEVWTDELPNMKSDLAELRSMLNTMAAQESSVDPRTAAAIQTNRKMWQVAIARLAELTQRMDAMERTQNSKDQKR